LAIFETEAEKLMHQDAILKGWRVDGRDKKDLRPIECQVGFLKRTHGTGLFIRGQTKVLSVLTLGGPGDQKILEEMELQGKKDLCTIIIFRPIA